MYLSLTHLSLVGALSLAVGSVATQAALVFSYDFETITTGVGPSPYTGLGNTALPNSPAIGTVGTSTSSRNVQVISGNGAPDPGHGGSKYLRMVNVPSTPNFQATLSETVSDLEATMDLYGLGRILVRLDSSSFLEFQTVVSATAGSWDIQHRNTTAGGSAYTTFATVTAAWHELTLTTNAATSTFQVKVDGASAGAPQAFLLNAPAGTPTFNRLYFAPNGSTTLPFYLDNLVVQSIPEPTSLAAVAGLGLLALGRRRRA